jgi:orotidine-5'-phosphate decarboxylase
LLSNSFYQKINKNIFSKNNFICLGLDPDINKIPDHFSKDINGLEQFLVEVIENTLDLCIAYKPNVSFFEALGLDGLRLLERIRKRIPQEIPVIFDAKRGDIGNTSKKQAEYIFDYFGADAITLHPYMGLESLEPFLSYKDKYHFILTLTSNPGAAQFEKQSLANGNTLYLEVAKSCQKALETHKNIGLVVGATQNELEELRNKVPEPLFLIPGVGQQGGSYEDAVKYGKNKDGLAIINITRSILYCSTEKDYISKIRKSFFSTT